MRLSVIVPVLDEERVIDARLRELAAIGAWEILVVDGGSRDATRAIVGRHPAARLVNRAPRQPRPGIGPRGIGMPVAQPGQHRV